MLQDDWALTLSLFKMMLESKDTLIWYRYRVFIWFNHLIWCLFIFCTLVEMFFPPANSSQEIMLDTWKPVMLLSPGNGRDIIYIATMSRDWSGESADWKNVLFWTPWPRKRRTTRLPSLQKLTVRHRKQAETQKDCLPTPNHQFSGGVVALAKPVVEAVAIKVGLKL